jgi:hypothetical protein
MSRCHYGDTHVCGESKLNSAKVLEMAENLLAKSLKFEEIERDGKSILMYLEMRLRCCGAFESVVRGNDSMDRLEY